MKIAARIAVICTAAAMAAGCAPQQKITAETASDHLVCRAMFGPDIPDGIRREAEQQRRIRNLDCTPYVAAMQQQRAADAASGALLIQQGTQLMRPPVRPGIRCTSTPMGMGTVQTNCY